MTELEKEWTELIIEAKNMGLSMKEIREFLQLCENENKKKISYWITRPDKMLKEGKFM